jgi:hypothetical protein
MGMGAMDDSDSILIDHGVLQRGARPGRRGNGPRAEFHRASPGQLPGAGSDRPRFATLPP